MILHEYVHIQRFDAATKLLLTAVLCLHWFNPLVWLMYTLANRDLELSCDETVLRRFGGNAKSSYAHTLIQMEEKKSGLRPLCNSFSKNAIEERVTAIMKTKKTSLIAVVLAVLLVAGLGGVFATTAWASPSQLTAVPGTQFTQEEYDKLLALQVDGFEQMTVAEYRHRVLQLMDTPEMVSLLQRFGQDTQLQELRYTNETAFFLYNILEPLCAESWEEPREFGGYVTVELDAAENATMEYWYSLTILDGNSLTVGQYAEAGQGVREGLESFFKGRTLEQLQQAEELEAAMIAEAQRLQTQWSTDALQVDIWTYVMPLSSLPKETLDEIAANWEESLAPYLAFGISYVVDQWNGQAKLYWNGEQVRGIYDPHTGAWMTNSAGITSYEEGLKELVAVYEGDTLTGLREANEQEQQEFSDLRAKNSSELTAQAGEEPRDYPPRHRGGLPLSTGAENGGLCRPAGGGVQRGAAGMGQPGL